MKRIIYSILGLSLLLTSCNSESDASTEETAQENTKGNTEKVVVEESKKMYSLAMNTFEIKWIAFKLADKIGVNGQFKEYEVDLPNVESENVSDLLKDAKISIPVSSTKTGDEVRDGKIINSFFGSMIQTDTLYATVVSLTGETEGVAVVSIKMNDVSLEQNMKWAYKADINNLMLKGTLNVPDWNAQSALDALNVVCEEKHRGEGDVAVTWPDVDVVANVVVELK